MNTDKKRVTARNGKEVKKAFQGICTLRNGIGGAGRLAIAGQLGAERKCRELRSAKLLRGAFK